MSRTEPLRSPQVVRAKWENDKVNDTLLNELEADGFGHWLAGFIDGEGCFIIRISGPGCRSKQRPMNCAFALQLRIDDLTILEECMSRTGLGRIITFDRKASNPGARWIVDKKADCLAFTRLLDEFPLRAKKARDYAIWREAVLHWQSVRNGRPRGSSKPSDWTTMRRMKVELSAQRAYQPTAAQ